MEKEKETEMGSRVQEVSGVDISACSSSLSLLFFS